MPVLYRPAGPARRRGRARRRPGQPGGRGQVALAPGGGLGQERGWQRLRVLSSAGTTYNRDYRAETPDGRQVPMLNVFHRQGGTIRHFWGSELFYAPPEPGQDPRHVGTIEPVWNIFDLTPGGRGPDWDEQVAYTE